MTEPAPRPYSNRLNWNSQQAALKGVGAFSGHGPLPPSPALPEHLTDTCLTKPGDMNLCDIRVCC
ncbi:MAG TPA: hypothetical protein VJX67_11895, partial [Blastocatellia bacterium]|nr:hypothetical protein [Blastocatellia bacterium]